MGKLAILIALALCPALSAGNIDKKFPDLLNLSSYGCVVRGPIIKRNYNDPAGRTRAVWVLTVWAEHRDPLAKKAVRDWKLWYSDRRKRAKALSDCDRWMEKVAKKLRASLSQSQ